MRPKGWENPYKPSNPNEGCGKEDIYEAGADAMLEGLKKDSFPVGRLISSVFLTNLPYDATLIEYEGKKGHLVFIEDKEE